MITSQRPMNLFSAFVNLARLRIVIMVLVSCAIGFILAYRGQFLIDRFLWALIGTAIVSGGSCALNCYVERDLDALMPRTRGRPIPAGVISPPSALAFGASMVAAGCLLLFFEVNLLSAFLALTAAVVYLAMYTPAKRLTWLNTSIGAVPGAIPPLIGCAAAAGQIEPSGWILFAMLFLWQHTHFFPIAWLFKDDYKEAGFRMLPVVEASGQMTFRLTVLTAVALLPLSLLLYTLKLAGSAYFFAATLFGLLLIAAGIRLFRLQTRVAARHVLLLSLCYLPMILVAVVLDRCGASLSNHLIAWLGVV